MPRFPSNSFIRFQQPHDPDQGEDAAEDPEGDEDRVVRRAEDDEFLDDGVADGTLIHEIGSAEEVRERRRAEEVRKKCGVDEKRLPLRVPEGLKALQDEGQRSERVDCTADEQGEELRAAGDESEGLADDGKGIEDGLPEGGQNDPCGGDHNECTKYKVRAVDLSGCREKCRANGGNLLLDGNVPVAVWELRALFEKDIGGESGEGGDCDDAEDDVAEREDRDEIVCALYGVDEGNLSHPSKGIEKGEEYHGGQSEREDAHEDEREGEPSAAADVMQTAHRSGDHAERYEGCGAGEDEDDARDEENPERRRRLAEKHGRHEIGDRQKGGEGGKREERRTAAECADGQRVVAPRESPVRRKECLIHDNAPSALWVFGRSDIRRCVRIGRACVGIFVQLGRGSRSSAERIGTVAVVALRAPLEKDVEQKSEADDRDEAEEDEKAREPDVVQASDHQHIA